MFMYILLGLIVLVALFWVGVYNNLIKARNGVEGSFSQIDVQLQRRNDLIPNLVETVKGYAKHESETLEKVTQARQQLINLPSDASPEMINNKSNELTSALSRLLVVSEQYPDLKANSNFQELQRTLEDTENKIAVSRQLYNSSVQTFNEKVQVFPNNFVAGVHGFNEKAYLEAPEAARQAPQVSFN
ncbi:LemA family protein [Facklamia miroungae]|uniref:LemA protein n=1 Tax=Facklamia miroungae TaxID=120956 RepID=A0A1G7S330_9LACT|nr:LemA family protein [Facklamia miroungae]NKZ29179.1 LemA family protein [Facklamia miroungae]SDG17465.1 LemA protein [Facklamia miroungae]